MGRLTEYHCGVAVIKNKELFSEAMTELAAYEDAYHLRITDNVQLLITITDQMLVDYVDCGHKASVVGGDGKNCEGCSLNADVFGSGLCEYPAISEELLRRIKEKQIKI